MTWDAFKQWTLSAVSVDPEHSEVSTSSFSQLMCKSTAINKRGLNSDWQITRVELPSGSSCTCGSDLPGWRLFVCRKEQMVSVKSFLQQGNDASSWKWVHSKSTRDTALEPFRGDFESRGCRRLSDVCQETLYALWWPIWMMVRPVDSADMISAANNRHHDFPLLSMVFYSFVFYKDLCRPEH